MNTRMTALASAFIAAWVTQFPTATEAYKHWSDIHQRGADPAELDQYNTFLCDLIHASVNFVSFDPSTIRQALSCETLVKDDGTLYNMITRLQKTETDSRYDNVISHVVSYFATREDIIHDGSWQMLLCVAALATD